MTELEEDHEVISVGDRIKRLAENATSRYYGCELDEVSWRFDQYAPMLSTSAWSISGTVTAISAIYVNLTEIVHLENIFGPRPGSTHLEEILTTLNTRDPERLKQERELANHQPPPGVHGWYGPTTLQSSEGDESLTGWLFTLIDELIRPVPPCPPGVAKP